MPDSLVIADRFELLGGSGGVQSDIPECQNAAGRGAVFQLYAPQTSGQGSGAQETWSLGEPQPVIDITQTLMLDGERPFGARASNRTITLPLKITAPDQVTLTAARELLMQAVDAQTFTMIYTPASTGLPVVFDCFRAEPANYGYGFLQNQPIPICNLTLTFQALPYGRTEPSSLTQVAFASPLLGGVGAPPAPVVLDNYATVSGTNWSRSTTQFVVGPGTARYTPPTGQVYPWLKATYARSGLSVNITGLPTLSVWLGQSFDTGNWAPWAPFQSNVTMRWTLTDNASHTISFSRSAGNLPWSNNANTPKWTRVSAAIPQGKAGFNYGQVTAYSLILTNWAGGGTTSWVRMNAWLDALTANPPSLSNPASQRGVVYNIMGTAGTARTPVSTQFQLPQSGPVTSELHGAGQWWPPVGVTSVQAECVGAGGAGATRTTTGFGGGGGGGEYAAEAALAVAAGTPVPYSCGAAGSSGASQQVTTFTQPGTGNWTCPPGVTTVKAECWGGGGQGAAGGGGGAGGSYSAEPTLAVTPGRVYRFTVGIGGYNTRWGFGAAGNGGVTTFAGDSVTVTASGGNMPRSGGTVGGSPGAASGNTTHFLGGAGGTSPSYAGGGGGAAASASGNGTAGSNGAGNTGGAGAAGAGGGGGGGGGANNPGYPAAGTAPGGGGGGGYGAAGNNAGASGGPGQITLTYTVAAGAPVNGASTTFGSAGTTGTVVTAHGGASAALNSAAGAAGGSGSGNTAHFSGGAGSTVTSVGGGGGGSGGSASAGTAAAANSATGAVAVTGGGKGANGSAVAGTGGDSASPPGGGGGGGDSSGTAAPGGAGGAGSIVLTWTPPLAPFTTLIAHTPGRQAPPSLNPCVPVNNTADTPTGIEYPVPSLVAGTNAMFNGTYSVVLVAYNWDSPAVQRTVTVTVTQYEYYSGAGDPAYQLAVTRTFTPATDISNGICIMGELTLPVKLVDPSNTSSFFTVSITDTDQNDQFLDVLFLDSQGSTVLVNLPPGASSYVNMFIDEPTADRDLGLILGSDLDRSQAVSVMDAAIISGSPFYILPGDNTFLAYTTAGAPNLGVSYLNRWYLERLV
jgi:hypothetical protein